MTFVGVRNWSQIPVRSLGKYKLQVALGDVLLTSGPSSKPYGTSFNLLDPFTSGYVVRIISKGLITNLNVVKNLPVNFDYWPSMVITHIDCSRKKDLVVGIAMVSNTQRYYVKDTMVKQEFTTYG